MADKSERRGLGRGLSALMSDIRVDAPTSGATKEAYRRAETLVPVERLFPNPDQPRRDFSSESLESLAASLREKGVLQPLIVRPRPEAGTFEIVAGERRWRAAQIAQIHDVPVIIRDFNDVEVLEVAIIENIQRADLNALEEATALRQLMDRFGHTQEKLGEALSKSRSYIANLLRLLSLPDDVQELLRNGALTAGHARALVTSPNASALAKQIVAKSLSVREAERLVKHDANVPAEPPKVKKTGAAEKDADTRALEADLSANLRMTVRISHEPGGERGVIAITYNTLDDLDLLCRALSQLPRDGSV